MRAALIPASTSRAAPLMSRLRSNCSVMPVVPSVLEEVISVTPAMWPNWRSRGVAIEDAMMSGLAPGKRGRHRDGREIDLRQRRYGQHA